MKLKKLWLGIGLPVLVIIIGVVAFVQPIAYLPHQHIVLNLPFSPQYDASTTMIPMGETIYHPKPRVPHGHPGIDFAWDNIKVPVIASAAGKIVHIGQGSNSSGTDVIVQTGVYQVRYKEMQTLAPGLKIGQAVKISDVLGYPGEFQTEHGTHYNLHWEFASISLLRDRFCPLTYLEPTSLQRINAIWAQTPVNAFQNMKQHFPNICSGDYAGKVE